MTMKRILLSIVFIPIIIILLINLKTKKPEKEIPIEEEKDNFSVITGIVQPQDTLEAIFVKHNLSRSELSEIIHSAKKLYNLSKLSVGNIYFFKIDNEESKIQNMQYEINDSSFLKITKMPEGFSSERVNIEYTKRTGTVYINIKDNLILSLPNTQKEYLKVAFKLSDIYAWDIDFTSDIRNGDSVKVIVEELWLGNVFKGYGNILAAEFFNNGTLYKAYRFEHEGYIDYYNEKGESLKKALLRSPLKFRYISSHFSHRRFHPILRIYRPHLGVDYVAPTGTPVSAAGSGTVLFAGYKGQNGKMVRIKHKGGFETFYGHLSRIPKTMKKGIKVSQGDIIGYVGSTGLSTGPHLDYRIKKNGRFVNPLKIELPRGEPIPTPLLSEFKKVVDYMDIKFASLTQPFIALSEKSRENF
jgi:murein DD-endopeptidase MepM/ murein hydrolase activator NlpD